MSLLIKELLNVDFDKHCRDCPYNEHDIIKRFNNYLDNVNVDKVIANPDIANDLDLLQKHYTILLDYYCDLEENNDKQKQIIKAKDRNINKLEQDIEYLKEEIKRYENIINSKTKKKNKFFRK